MKRVAVFCSSEKPLSVGEQRTAGLTSSALSLLLRRTSRCPGKPHCALLREWGWRRQSVWVLLGTQFGRRKALESFSEIPCGPRATLRGLTTVHSDFELHIYKVKTMIRLNCVVHIRYLAHFLKHKKVAVIVAHGCYNSSSFVPMNPECRGCHLLAWGDSSLSGSP